MNYKKVFEKIVKETESEVIKIEIVSKEQIQKMKRKVSRRRKGKKLDLQKADLILVGKLIMKDSVTPAFDEKNHKISLLMIQIFEKNDAIDQLVTLLHELGHCDELLSASFQGAKRIMSISIASKKINKHELIAWNNAWKKAIQYKLDKDKEFVQCFKKEKKYYLAMCKKYNRFE